MNLNWGSGFFWGGRHTNELEDIRMNWASIFVSEDVGMNWNTHKIIK